MMKDKNKKCPVCGARCTPWTNIWVCDCCGYGKTLAEKMPRNTDKEKVMEETK